VREVVRSPAAHEVVAMESAGVTPLRGVRFLVATALAAFVLNWPWELLHTPVYSQMAGRPWRETLPMATVASLGDIAIALAIYGVGALASGDWRWGMCGRWHVYATCALLGAACAVSYEWRALAVGRWSYTERMPMVPLLGVGLWPLLQLTVLVPLAFALGRWWSDRTRR
jgi:hypothetical protein